MFTPSLNGSGDALLMQNRMADDDNLSRIPNREERDRFARLKLLVPLRRMPGIAIDPRLPVERSLCRPQTERFLNRLGKQFFERFGHHLWVTSAFRSLEDQAALRTRNTNAAATSGPFRSVHPTGAVVDISHSGLTKAEKQWMRNVLLSLERRGLVEATEEHSQPCFHIMVSKKYLLLPALS